jgi:hypothetical protein
VLASFWRLLEWLHASGEVASWAVILRTYGTDLGWLLADIATFAAGRFPVETKIHTLDRDDGGRFKLMIPPDRTLAGEARIVRWLENVRGVVGIEDDFQFWEGNHFTADTAKPIWVRPDGGAVHVLFDDNIRFGTAHSVADVRVWRDGQFSSAFVCRGEYKGFIDEEAK